TLLECVSALRGIALHGEIKIAQRSAGNEVADGSARQIHIESKRGREFLHAQHHSALLRVQELSAALGFNVYLTGGTVRDLVTGASLRDLDFTVECNPSKSAHAL